MGGCRALGKGLLNAVKAGDTALVQTLLAAKAPVDQTYRGHIRLTDSQIPQPYSSVHREYTDEYGCTSLSLASRRGHSASMELLLAAKANVHQTNTHGYTALMWAINKMWAMHGYNAPVELLLAAKANVEQTAKSGATALVIASKQPLRCIGHVETLLAAKANVAHIDKWGHTALHYASKQQDCSNTGRSSPP